MITTGMMNRSMVCATRGIFNPSNTGGAFSTNNTIEYSNTHQQISNSGECMFHEIMNP